METKLTQDAIAERKLNTKIALTSLPKISCDILTWRYGGSSFVSLT